MPVEELHKSDGAALHVPADSNLIIWQVCRSAIDHRSTDTGQFAIGMVVSLGSAGTHSELESRTESLHYHV